jgi:hypothetical protein
MAAEDEEKAKALRRQQERSQKRLLRRSSEGISMDRDDALDSSSAAASESQEGKKMKLMTVTGNAATDPYEHLQSPMQSAGSLQQYQHQQHLTHSQHLEELHSLQQFYLEREKMRTDAELEMRREVEHHAKVGERLSELTDQFRQYGVRLTELERKSDQTIQLLNTVLSSLATASKDKSN